MIAVDEVELVEDIPSSSSFSCESTDEGSHTVLLNQEDIFLLLFQKSEFLPSSKHFPKRELFCVPFFSCFRFFLLLSRSIACD